MKGKLVFEPKQSDTPGTCHFAHDLAHALSNTWGSDHIAQNPPSGTHARPHGYSDKKEKREEGGKNKKHSYTSR